MTTRQAEEATTKNIPYALAVLPLGNYEINIENVKQHARFVINIKEKLLQKYQGLQRFVIHKNEAVLEKNGVSLNIEDGQIRYQIKSAVWENVLCKDFTGFVEWLKNLPAS